MLGNESNDINNAFYIIAGLCKRGKNCNGYQEKCTNGICTEKNTHTKLFVGIKEASN